MPTFNVVYVETAIDQAHPERVNFYRRRIRGLPGLRRNRQGRIITEADAQQMVRDGVLEPLEFFFSHDQELRREPSGQIVKITRPEEGEPVTTVVRESDAPSGVRWGPGS